MDLDSNKTIVPHPIPEKVGITVVLIHPHTIKDNYHEGTLGKHCCRKREGTQDSEAGEERQAHFLQSKWQWACGNGCSTPRRE